MAKMRNGASSNVFLNFFDWGENMQRAQHNFTLGFFLAFAGLLHIFPDHGHSTEKTTTAADNNLSAADMDELDHVLAMSIQELMQLNVSVTSPSKKPEKLHQAASAIYVITQEDIRRSGATNIMEALRMAPGVLVSKINQNQYAVSVRGFNSRFGSNKLLVLMDGRTIYSPVFSGVDWVAQDTALEDIDRIEVIRGSGAALWGSNAVAGVINIITKSSSQTQGTLLSGGAGNEETGFVTARYGAKQGENLDYRIYYKYRAQDAGIQSNGTEAFDSKQSYRTGFRSDWRTAPASQLTVQGDFYETATDKDSPGGRVVSFTSPFTLPYKDTHTYSGANLLSRWTHSLGSGSDIKVQAYFDRAVRDSAEPSHATVDQGDIEFQHNFRLGEVSEIAWGLHYRYSLLAAEQSVANQAPETQNASLFGFFVHDEITLIPQTWNIIAGSKFEHNKFTGFEMQPNVRTVWQPHANHTLWAAFSRAVRIPSFSESNGNYNIAGTTLAPGAPMIFRLLGNNSLRAEEALIYEAGYRVAAAKNLSFDFTGFFNQYRKLIEYANTPTFFESQPAPAHLVFPLTSENSLKGEVYGAEIAAEWRPLKPWKLAASYAYNKVDLRPAAGKDPRTIVSIGVGPETDPNYLFTARSYLELPYNLEFDSFLYYVSRNRRRVDVRDNARTDLRLGWRPQKQLELSLIAQNVFDPRHAEFENVDEARSETQRSYYCKATFRFY